MTHTEAGFRTLTGMTREQVVERMQEYLGQDAYKEVGGASYLTDINPAYTREVLTACFGLCGEGWWYDYSEIAIRSNDKGQPIATIDRFELHYAYIEGGESVTSRPVLSAGGSKNRNVEDAMKGAVTSALQKAASMLLFQLDVYKGKVSHKTPPPAKKEPVAYSPDKRPSSKSDILAAVRYYAHENKTANDKQRSLMVGMLEECFGGSGNEEGKRKAVTMYLFGKESSKELADAQVLSLLDWLKPAKDSGGAYLPCEEACAEAKKIVIARMKAAGQEAMEL